MNIQQELFGTTRGGEAVDVFKLTNADGLCAEFISYGAAVKSLRLPAADGSTEEITYGFDTLAEYETSRFFFGATVGRYANRIARGRFVLEGKEYALACNDGANHLHGGVAGFDRRVWAGAFSGAADGDSESVTFSYNSPDGEEGYPGNLAARATYTITGGNELIITFEATTDAPGPFNPTNHTYWNLAGASNGSILSHALQLNCPLYLPADSALIPTGEIRAVKNTPMDFLTAKPIGRDIAQVKPNGYDHCFVIARDAGVAQTERVFAARVTHPESGRSMEAHTTMPGIQVYSGNNITPAKIAGGAEARFRGAFCLEPEFYPDSVNRGDFPSPILFPGKKFYSQTMFKFSW